MGNNEVIQRLEELRKYIRGAYVLAYGGANVGAVAQITKCLNMLDEVIYDLTIVQ